MGCAKGGVEDRVARTVERDRAGQAVENEHVLGRLLEV